MVLCAVCHRDTLVFGERVDVGIVTLWTKKEHVLKALEPQHYGVVGQLYSRDEGISCIIRNCLSNKSIRYIVLCGIDLYNSGEALLALVKNGVDEQHRVIGVAHAVVQKEIPLDAINRFRASVQVYDYRSLREYGELRVMIEALPVLPSYGEPESFPEPRVEAVDSWPCDPVGFKVVGKTVGEVWLEILDTVMRFGVRKETEYGSEMKELINLLAVVTDEDPENPVIADQFNFTREELEEYIPKMLTDLAVRDVEYTYGQRLRAHFGKDQIAGIIDYLRRTPFTRRAVAVTWDVAHDLGNPKAPCLDLLQCLIQDGKLWMTVYFRSNDMFDAWPRNALALRRMQGQIAHALDVGLGSLCTMSCSAHIYNGSWALAQKLVTDYLRLPVLELDPRGNFVISLENGEIAVRHYSPQGGKIDEFKGKTVKEITNQLLLRKHISLVSHALYVGRELQKAQTALELGLGYSQDQPLTYTK